MSSALFSPITLRGLTLPNRIVVSPMCQYSRGRGQRDRLAFDAPWQVRGVRRWPRDHRGDACRGPAAESRMAVSGSIATTMRRQLTRVVDFCRKVGTAKIGMQISHSGRKGSTRLPWIGRGEALTADEQPWETIAPSAVPHAPGWPAPRELDAEGLEVAKAVHVEATRRAVRIGIDLIEAHIAHGYFLHEFLSPLSNKRTDAYGGSLANPMRYPLEVFAAIRAVWPADRPMGVRHSVTDWAEGGWTPRMLRSSPPS